MCFGFCTSLLCRFIDSATYFSLPLTRPAPAGESTGCGPPSLKVYKNRDSYQGTNSVVPPNEPNERALSPCWSLVSYSFRGLKPASPPSANGTTEVVP